MSVKIKYNLAIFDKAAELVEMGYPWCCNLISEAATRLGARKAWVTCRERDLFESVYDIHNPIYQCLTFSGIHRLYYPEEGDLSVLGLIEIRLLALAFVREIARRKNRQGSHAARNLKRAMIRANKVKE